MNVTPQGDQLIATSGVIYTSESDYGGATVKGGQKLVRLRVQGEVSRREEGGQARWRTWVTKTGRYVGERVPGGWGLGPTRN